MTNNKQQWISVKDRLPEEHKYGISKDVLTISGCKMQTKCYDHEIKQWSGSNYIRVTHWMPLPEPPQS
jgi:hypothetical protein